MVRVSRPVDPFARTGERNWPLWLCLAWTAVGAHLFYFTQPWDSAWRIFSVPCVFGVANLFGRLARDRGRQGAALQRTAVIAEWVTFFMFAMYLPWALVFWLQRGLPPA